MPDGGTVSRVLLGIDAFTSPFDGSLAINGDTTKKVGSLYTMYPAVLSYNATDPAHVALSESGVQAARWVAGVAVPVGHQVTVSHSLNNAGVERPGYCYAWRHP